MKRRWMGVAVAVVLLAAAAGLFWSAGNTARHGSRAADQTGLAGMPAPGQAPQPTVTAPVETASLVSTPRWIEGTGTVSPEFESSIAAKVTGRVAVVAVREGDSVRQGQVLVQLDARDLDASVSSAAASVRAAAAGTGKAQAALAMEALLDQARVRNARAGVVRAEAAARASQAQFDAVKAGPRRQEREQAAQATAGAQATLTLAESNLQKIGSLFQQGAVSRQLYESTLADAQVARAKLASAKQAESLAQEGSRPEDIRAAAGAVDEARASLVQAHDELAQARAQALQVNVRREEARAAEAQINESTAALETARITRAFAAVSAPFDGVVSARLVDPGAMAGPGTPLLKIQGGQLRIEAVVPEDNLNSVRLGDTVSVELDALQRRPLPGRVVEIAPQGDPASHTFVIKVALPSNSGAKAGMFGRVRFPAGSIQQLLAPQSAVWEQQGLHYLFVVDNTGIAHLRMVTVGDPVDGSIEVLSGLNAGERLVTGDRERVTDGARIVPR